MKIVTIILLINISFNSFSQSNFLKRKYTKGIFYEKAHRLNHSTKHQFTNTVDAENHTTEPKSIMVSTAFLVNEDLISEPFSRMMDTVKNTETKKTVIKTSYSGIVKHNTICVDTSNQYASINKIVIIKINNDNKMMGMTKYQNQSNKKSSAADDDGGLILLAIAGLIALGAGIADEYGFGGVLLYILALGLLVYLAIAVPLATWIIIGEILGAVLFVILLLAIISWSSGPNHFMENLLG